VRRQEKKKKRELCFVNFSPVYSEERKKEGTEGETGQQVVKEGEDVQPQPMNQVEREMGKWGGFLGRDKKEREKKGNIGAWKRKPGAPPVVGGRKKRGRGPAAP